MSSSYHIVVCGTIVPDPLQTLEPIQGLTGPALKNELMLPAILDPWASHALYEAACLAAKAPGSKIWLVALGPKIKLHQVMTQVAQKAPFELIVVDGPASGFADSFEVADALTGAIESIVGLDRSRLLIFGGWQSASRGAGTTLQMVGERLGITDQFQGVDECNVETDDSLTITERVEAASYLIMRIPGPPAVLGWATGNLPEPPNNPQLGMQNMHFIISALKKANSAQLPSEGLNWHAVELPKQRRKTRIVKNVPAEAIAAEIVAWIKS
ncbi:electron transfer flavoprotein beta subunit [Desulfovibrionales bacterium]